MRRFRIVLIVLGACLALGALGGIAAFVFTRGAVSAADDFFTAVAKQGPDAAYAEAAPAFRNAGSAASFAQAADKLGLRGFRSANWASRSISGREAQLEGTLALAENGTLPITVKLVKDEAGAWRVLAINTPRPGLQAAAPDAPDEAQARQLAQVTLMQLAEAIHARDFRGLWAATSTDFRQQFTAETLAQQFKGAMDANLDLTRADMKAFTFHEPPRIEGGVLTIKGVLPPEARSLYFEFGYAPEAGGWLPISLALSSHVP